jgi:hypothetical protein
MSDDFWLSEAAVDVSDEDLQNLERLLPEIIHPISTDDEL